jgi:hypothetical protein
MIGKNLTPILNELEATILEFKGNKPNYGDSALRSASQIFIDVVMDKMFDLQESENIPLEERSVMAKKCGLEIRKLLKTYCNVDSYDFYKETIIFENGFCMPNIT